MNQCYLCATTDEKALLYEGIHKSKGIVHVCRKCYFKDKLVLIDKKEINVDKINSRESVRERLSKMAHIKTKPSSPTVKKVYENYENVQLKNIVEKNFKKEILTKSKPPEDLVDNFHWVVMRKRRSKKISKESLAEMVQEPLIAIESLEKGILPGDYKPLIKKIETILEIRISKNNNFDNNSIFIESKIPSGILIEDLRKETKKEKEKYIDASAISLDKINEIYGVPSEAQDENHQKEDNKKKSSKKDLSDEDISKLVWGK